MRKDSEISIVITAAGAPQAATLIRHLKGNGEREVRIIALDMDEDAVGRFLADAFHRIPPAGSDGYDDAILEIIEAERPAALLNCSGSDVPLIARLRPRIEALNTRVLCSDSEVVELVNNKHRLYRALEKVENVSVPEYCSPASLDEFVAETERMGYPERELCFKPHVSKGSRGFRFLSERFDRRDLLLNHKPISRYMTLDDFVSIFRAHKSFPDLLLMETVTGVEHDVMVLGYDGEALLTTVKTRESDRWGVIDRGALVDAPEIVTSAAAITRTLDLSYNVSIQFIGGKIIEINPRTSTFIFADGFNEPWLAVKLCLGLISPDEVRAFQDRVPYGHRMVRYMDQIFFDGNGRWWQ